jgi:drug/metabolite transporter (DMT)-like permease
VGHPNPRRPRGRALGIALVLLSACAFGSGALFAKPVYATGLDWMTLLAWRFGFAALASWIWLLARPADRRALLRIPRRRVLGLLSLGVLYVINSGTYFAALETVPASLAALIVYIYPALVAVLALRWGRRLPGRRPWLALGMASVGVLLALGGIPAATAPPIAGIALAVASPIIYSVWIILSARLAGERPATVEAVTPEAIEAAAKAGEATAPAPAAALMITATWLVYLVAATATGRPTNPFAVPPEAWVGLLGVGLVSTAIAIQSFYAGTRRIGAAQAALVSTVEPIWTITLASILFSERLGLLQLLGGALIIAGVVLAQTAASPDRAVVGPAVAAKG